MRHCLWGQLYMESSMDRLANYAQQYYEKHSDVFINAVNSLDKDNR